MHIYRQLVSDSRYTHGQRVLTPNKKHPIHHAHSPTPSHHKQSPAPTSALPALPTCGMPLKLATAILLAPCRTCLDLWSSPLSRSEGGSGMAFTSRPMAVGTGTVHVMRLARRLCDASLNTTSHHITSRHKAASKRCSGRRGAGVCSIARDTGRCTGRREHWGTAYRGDDVGFALKECRVDLGRARGFSVLDDALRGRDTTISHART